MGTIIVGIVLGTSLVVISILVVAAILWVAPGVAQWWTWLVGHFQ